MDTKTKKLMENMFEISAIAENMQIEGSIHVEDSRELFHCALTWAEDFEASFDEDGRKDYLMEIEDFARAKLRENFHVSKDNIREITPYAISLPNGAIIKTTLCGDAKPAVVGANAWSSIDITILLPDGNEATLCAVDYEHNGRLRVLAFDYGEEDPEYDREYTWKHYAYWVQHEEADDTYDICIWDEFANERVENLEEARFPSSEAAYVRLSEIQRGISNVWWIRRDDTIGKG